MLARVRHANGAVYTIANDPDSMRRPRSITLTDANGVPAMLGPFAYDGASNMTASGSESYVFDGVSRLVRATFGSGSEQSYAFDAYGNTRSITTMTGGVPSTRTMGVSASTNRLTSASYDAAGNVTAWNGNAYAYDAVSMMKSLNASQLYVYSADDMRVMLYDATKGEERWRLRGLGQEVLRENVRTTAGWAWARDYVFRDGEMLASISAAEGTRHQHPNHLGTPRVITDESGLIVASQLLRPFGEEASGSGAATGFLKFTGHERDINGSSVTNHLDYMRARYYSPHLGRFLSPDRVLGAVELPQSWNRYTYVRNNPVKFVDPDGQEALAAQRLNMDIKAVISGEMSTSEFQARNKARAQGVAVAASLFIPGPEDVALGLAASSRLGPSIAGRIGGFFKRIFSRGNSNSVKLRAISGGKLSQQIARFRAVGGKGGRDEFINFATNLAGRARKSGNAVTGRVGRGQQSLENATIFREGKMFLVVDESGAIRSFVEDAKPDTGIVKEFLRLGGKL